MVVQPQFWRFILWEGVQGNAVKLEPADKFVALYSWPFAALLRQWLTSDAAYADDHKSHQLFCLLLGLRDS